MVEYTIFSLEWTTFWRHILYGTFSQFLNYLGHSSLLAHAACFSTCTCVALASTCGDRPYWKPNASTRSFFTTIILFPALSSFLLDKDWNTHLYDSFTVFAYSVLIWATQTSSENTEETPARLEKQASSAQDKQPSGAQDDAFRPRLRRTEFGLRVRRTVLVLVLLMQLATGLAPNIESVYNRDRCQVHEQQIDTYTWQVRATGWRCDRGAQSLTIDRVTRESLRAADMKTCGVRCVEMCLCANNGKDLSAHLSIAPTGTIIDSAYCGTDSQFDTCVLGPFQG